MTNDYIFLIHRILGLSAFALIFIQIILGSLRINLKIHMKIGKVALILAILHPALLIGTNVSPFKEGFNQFYFSLGLIGLFLILLTAGAALLGTKVGPIWRYLHRLNYVLFWVIFFHSINLGIDTQSSIVKYIYYSGGIIVGLLTLFKIYSFAKTKLNKNTKSRG